MNTTVTPTQDQVFLEQLNEIFQKNFSAKIYPGDNDEVLEAEVHANEFLTRDQVSKISSLSDDHQLNFVMERDQLNVKINFKRKQ